MIEEDYVSFETAKLLKEKGFDEKCQKVYLHDGIILWASCFMEGESFLDYHDIELAANYDGWITYTQGNYGFLCPTQSVAMKWLREVHNLHIEIHYNTFGNNYSYIIQHSPIKLDDIRSYPTIFWEYEKACETAIQDCLQNLI